MSMYWKTLLDIVTLNYKSEDFWPRVRTFFVAPWKRINPGSI